MTEQDKRMSRVCFTGHRPEKLTDSEDRIKQMLELHILRAIADGFTVFMTGMARGVDLWAGQIVIKLRDSGTPIKLICVSAFCGVEKGWNPVWQNRYQTILQNADYVKYICKRYHPLCFQMRNEWMVNHVARVIAVFNGKQGGTKNTIAYAKRVGVPVIEITG